MVDVLYEKHANRILTFLFEKGEIKKTDLLEVVSSSDSLSNTIRKLEQEGFITTESKVVGRKIIVIKLTEKGFRVAKKLKEAEEVSEGKSAPITLNQSDYNNWGAHTGDFF
jgi:DNA-binding MarR family transcriptional regulator